MEIKQIRRLIRETHARIHWFRQHSQVVPDDPLEAVMLELRLAVLQEKKRETQAINGR